MSAESYSIWIISLYCIAAFSLLFAFLDALGGVIKGRPAQETLTHVAVFAIVSVAASVLLWTTTLVGIEYILKSIGSGS